MMSRQCPPDMPCSICFALLNAVAFVILMLHFVDKQWRSDYLEYNHFAACDSEVGLAWSTICFHYLMQQNLFSFLILFLFEINSKR